MMVFVAFFLGNSVSDYWLLDTSSICFKLVDHKDGESEKEEKKNEEQFDKKIRLIAPSSNSLFNSPLMQSNADDIFQSIHPLEIPTPPPELELTSLA